MPSGGARKGAGRPPGDARGTATQQIQIRVTPHEKQVLKDRAARRGMSVSEYMKTAALLGKE